MILAQFLWHAFMQFNLFQSDNKINSTKGKFRNSIQSTFIRFIKKRISYVNMYYLSDSTKLQDCHQVTNFANSFKKKTYEMRILFERSPNSCSMLYILSDLLGLHTHITKER